MTWGRRRPARSIVVNNVPPTVRIESVGNQPAGTISLTAVVTDPGTSDTETLSWTLIVDGIASQPSLEPQLFVPDPELVRDARRDRDGDRQRRWHGLRQRPDPAHHAVRCDVSLSIRAGSPSRSAGRRSRPPRFRRSTRSSCRSMARTIRSMRAHSCGPVELDGYGSNETLMGGSGDDVLTAGAGANSLDGGPGNDTLVSNLGDDSLFGGAGNDVFFINPGPDPLVTDTSGFNTLNFSIAALGITLDLSQNTGQKQDRRLERRRGDVAGPVRRLRRLAARRQDHGQQRRRPDLRRRRQQHDHRRIGKQLDRRRQWQRHHLRRIGQHDDHQRRGPRLDRRRQRQRHHLRRIDVVDA